MDLFCKIDVSFAEQICENCYIMTVSSCSKLFLWLPSTHIIIKFWSSWVHRIIQMMFQKEYPVCVTILNYSYPIHFNCLCNYNHQLKYLGLNKFYWNLLDFIVLSSFSTLLLMTEFWSSYKLFFHVNFFLRWRSFCGISILIVSSMQTSLN